MKCPVCGESEDKVVDSRLNKNCEEIRRRRQCNGCGRRFTTYERIEEISVMISKKDGRREIFNREKLRVGIQKACEKRDISTDTIEKLLDELEKELGDTGKKEIPSCMVGEKEIGRASCRERV